MNRLKFRVFDKSDHELFSKGQSRMYYFGEEYFISDDGFLQFQSPPGKSPIGDHDQNRFSPIMQFTGLLDVNGKEIFEGDVVRGKIWDWKEYRVFEVTWDYLIPGWAPFVESWETCEGDERLRNDVEIIGNRWENPGLLTEGGAQFIMNQEEQTPTQQLPEDRFILKADELVDRSLVQKESGNTLVVDQLTYEIAEALSKAHQSGREQGRRETLDKLSGIIFDYFWRFLTPNGEEDDWAQEQTAKLMKRIKSLSPSEGGVK